MNENLEVWQGLLKIKNYCQNHECNNCNFMEAKGCLFKSGKSPNLWHTPKTIIMNANCPEIIVEELKKNETVIKESD